VTEIPSSQPLRVPLSFQTSVVYIDESGVATKEPIFVVGALKVRRHGQFIRAIRAVRERTGFEGEFHWSTVSRGTLPAYFDLIDTLANSDAHFAATVVDRIRYNPADNWPSLWEAHAQVVSQLLVGCINRSELVGVLMDTITTPSDVAHRGLRSRHRQQPTREHLSCDCRVLELEVLGRPAGGRYPRRRAGVGASLCGLRTAVQRQPQGKGRRPYPHAIQFRPVSRRQDPADEHSYFAGAASIQARSARLSHLD
jgi:hypothetical protein